MDNAKLFIRVNAVCPGWVRTPLMDHVIEKKPEAEGMATGSSPRGRMAVAEEVADYCVFLCSPSASWINGTALTIDSGTSLVVGAAWRGQQ